MPDKPGKPPRQTPSRESTRPGVRRERLSRTASQAVDEPTPDRAQAHAQARSKIISTLALGVTQRIIALVVTAAVLAISFVSSYSVYLGQQRDIAQAKADIAAREAEIARVQDQLERWQDPAYVRAQARDRLGWVMPGEVGYRVIDADGNVIGGTVAALDTPAKETTSLVWYEALLGSIEAADQPVPVPDPTVPTGPAIIGPDGVEPPR